MASMTAEREAELDHWREQTRNLWRISTDCGDPPTEADKVWDMVSLEMKFYCSNFMRGRSIAHHAQQWIETRNPFHVDAAVHLCSLEGFSPPPALADLVADVALKRLRGEVRSGTPGKIFRDATRDHALSMMTCLCAAGLTIEAAASKAAAELQNDRYGAQFKASVLEKYYVGQWRDLERTRREFFASEDGAGALAQWVEVIPNLADAPDELKGERR